MNVRRGPHPVTARSTAPCYHRHMRTVALSLLAALVTGCGAPAVSAPSPSLPTEPPATGVARAERPATVAPAAEPAVESQRRRQGLLMERAEQLVLALADVRGVTPSREWTLALIDRHEIRDFIDDELRKDYSDEELEIFGRVEAAFGVIPAGVDARELLLDLYEGSVLGLYDPARKTLFVGSFVPGTMLEMVLGHELAHGVQDMHLDLARLQEPLHESAIRGANDRETARTFLVEGDAQATYLAWLAGPRGPAGIDDVAARDAVDQLLAIDARSVEHPTLARIMQLPYLAGTATVLQLARERGWSAVDALYERLPPSSEQMLHIDKLLEDERPARISVNTEQLTSAAPSHRLEWIDERGEGLWLASFAGPERVELAWEAASGWHGDAFAALAHPDLEIPSIVGVTVWDTRDDAREFERALVGLREDTSVDARPHYPIIARRSGTRVYYAIADDRLSEEALTNAWACFVVSSPTPSDSRPIPRRP